MSEIIVKVCAMPRDFRNRGHKSMNQLFNESGYLKQPEAVTKERLTDYLRANPDLINDWENYSSDKRVSKGWYFVKDQSEWIVGYAGVPGQNQKQTFTSGFEACAEFILQELKEFAEHATRS